MQIHEKPARTTLAEADVFAVDTGSATYKAALSTLRGAVLNNLNTTGISTYPTAPGLYRVITSVSGLPSGASYYGVLAIFGAGTYYMHIFIGTDNNLYYAYKGSSGAPTKWYKVTGTATNPVS